MNLLHFHLLKFSLHFELTAQTNTTTSWLKDWIIPMELYDFVLECLSDSEILDDWNPSDKIQQKASDIVTEYLSEPDYRERLAEQIVESIDAGCYENSVFFEALNYEP